MLIFSRDEALVGLLQKSASRPAQHISDLSELRVLVGADRLDAVVVDCDDHSDGIAALKAVAASEANRQTPCVVITNTETAHADARDHGGWVVFEKTALWKQPDQVERWLGTVQKRQHKRFSQRMNGLVDSGDLMGRQVTVVNISVGGASFETSGTEQLERHLTLRIGARRLRGEIVWRDSKGRVGMRFLPGQLSDKDLSAMVT
jgi:hypothetical protein